ncbi:MAG: RNA-binding protein [Candidatus Nanopelagicales bacterium]|nr:RNA-binding protein [Candidatus Nanopelagicales bacterium]
MLAEALDHLVRGIVDNPDDVSVKARDGRRGLTLRVLVNPDDMGRVIGKAGRTATAFRTVITALAGRRQVRVDFSDGLGGSRPPRGEIPPESQDTSSSPDST